MAKNSIPMNGHLRNSHEENYQNTLLYQDMALVSELLQIAYQYYKQRSAVSEEAFIAFLRGFIEQIEATFEDNQTRSVDYYIHVLEFHRYTYKKLWREVTTLEPFFTAITYLIQYGVENFRAQNYPKAYESFLHQLEMIFDNGAIVKARKQRTAYLLLEQLRKRLL